MQLQATTEATANLARAWITEASQTGIGERLICFLTHFIYANIKMQIMDLQEFWMKLVICQTQIIPSASVFGYYISFFTTVCKSVYNEHILNRTLTCIIVWEQPMMRLYSWELCTIRLGDYFANPNHHGKSIIGRDGCYMHILRMNAYPIIPLYLLRV